LSRIEKSILSYDETFHRHYHDRIQRWMLFVDGENLTIRAQEIAKGKGIEVQNGPYFQKDTYIWPELMVQMQIILRGTKISPPLRSYYYTSVVGDDAKLSEIRTLLWRIGFHPEVFKKHKNRKSKGVDITLTKDILFHAFMDNYDMAVLVTGDADYLPVIEEIKRQGKILYLVFLEETEMDQNLILSADMFETIPTDWILSSLSKV